MDRSEADINLREGTAKRNCSICTNARAGFVLVKPARFQLLTEMGAQTEYLWTPRGIHGQTCTISFARSAAFAPPDAASTGRQEDFFTSCPLRRLTMPTLMSSRLHRLDSLMAGKTITINVQRTKISTLDGP